MRKWILFLVLGLLVAGDVNSQELQVGKFSNSIVLQVTNTTQTFSWDVPSRNVTLTNYDTADNVYVTWNRTVPDVALSHEANCYVLPPSFEKVKWLRTMHVTLRCASDDTAYVGVEYDY